jgi:hypothetical protein
METCSSDLQRSRFAGNPAKLNQESKMSGSVNTQDRAIKVQDGFSATAAFTAGLNLKLHRSSNVLW